MSLLEEQMKELQARQKKVAFLRNVAGLVSPSDAKTADPAEVEIAEEIQAFIEAKIDEIENGTPMPQAAGAVGQLTEEEVEFVREAAARAQQRGVVPAANPVNQNIYEEETPVQNNPMERQSRGNPPPPRRPGPQQPPQRRGQPDLVQFAQQNRHMNGKRVLVKTAQGKVGGTVVGIASVGYLQVQTDTGHAVPVPVDSITLE